MTQIRPIHNVYLSCNPKLAMYESGHSFSHFSINEKMKNGCSIMTDAWSDRKRRSIMNLVTNCVVGTTFLSSKEMSDVSHTSEVIFDLVDKTIEEVSEDEVVQVVTNNTCNNLGAKKLLLVKRPHIFWTSCGSHTINLMLQGIGSLPRFKKMLDQAKAFTIFVYGHTRTLDCMRHFTEEREIIRPEVTRFASTFLTLTIILEKKDQLRKMVVDSMWHTRTLDCMRHFTEGREIIRPGVTRFASAFLTLTSILEKKDQLRKMVVDSMWDTLRDVKSKKENDATATMMNPSFWKDVKMCLSVFQPLVKLFRFVDGM
jgi:hypothetical protein